MNKVGEEYKNKFFTSFQDDIQKDCLLLRLPKYLVRHIFTFLDSSKDFLNNRWVCRKFYNILQTDPLMNKFILPALSPNKAKLDWGHGALRTCDEVLCFKKKIQDKQFVEEKNTKADTTGLTRKLNWRVFYGQDPFKSKNCIFEFHENNLNGERIQAVNLSTKETLFFGDAGYYLYEDDVVYNVGDGGRYLAISRSSCGGLEMYDFKEGKQKVLSSENIFFSQPMIMNQSNKNNQFLPMIEEIQEEIGEEKIKSVTIHIWDMWDMKAEKCVSSHKKIIKQKDECGIHFKLMGNYIILSQYVNQFGGAIKALIAFDIKNDKKQFNVMNQGVVDERTDHDLSGFFVHKNFLLTKTMDNKIWILDMEEKCKAHSIHLPGMKQWGTEDNHLFITDGKSVEVWEIETKTCVHRSALSFEWDDRTCYCNLKDGYLIARSEQGIRCVNVKTGKDRDFVWGTDKAIKIKDSLCVLSGATSGGFETKHNVILDLTTGKELHRMEEDQDAIFNDAFWFDHGLVIRTMDNNYKFSMKVLDFRSFENQK